MGGIFSVLSTSLYPSLQTFPGGLVFDCGRSDVQRMLGNTLPSLLAEILAGEIRVQLLGDRRFKKRALLPPLWKVVPPPEKVARVPVNFKKYIGDHEDHPREGLGAAALRRKGEAAPVESPLFAAVK